MDNYFYNYSGKIQIISDIHLEYISNVKDIPIIKKYAPYLAILGDIGDAYKPNYEYFLKLQSEQFEKIFIVLGNHCFYNKKKTYLEILNQIKEVISRFNNIILLNQDTYDISENTTLIGCTLWCDIDPNIQFAINDFRYITLSINKTNDHRESLDIDTYKKWHFSDLEFIKKSIEYFKNTNKKLIILTHHAPSRIMAGKYFNSKYDSAFTNDLEYLFINPIIAFASGHIHSNVDTYINGIRTVSNAYGDNGEDTGYKENVTIEFD